MNRTHSYLIALTCGFLFVLPACSRTNKPTEAPVPTPCPVQPTEPAKDQAQHPAIHHLKTPQELEELLKKGKPVILKVSATWCGPCRYMLPLFEKEANKYCNRVIFAAVDADEKGMEEVISKFAPRGFPTFTFLDATGKQVKDHPGSYPEDEFSAEIKGFVEKYS